MQRLVSSYINMSDMNIDFVIDMALYKYRIVGHEIVFYMSVQSWYSDSVHAWYSI